MATFTVTGLAEAVAALTAAAEAGVVVRLVSAPAAGLYAGPGWWLALLARAAAEVPTARFEAVLDCADAGGAALAALRAGTRSVAVRLDGPARAALADIAAQVGARLVPPPAAPVDLARMPDPLAHCRDVLATMAPDPRHA